MAREKIAQFNYELVLKEMREEDPEFVEDGGGRRPRPPPGGMVWYPIRLDYGVLGIGEVLQI